jgi:hypothetical protein
MFFEPKPLHDVEWDGNILRIQLSRPGKERSLPEFFQGDLAGVGNFYWVKFLIDGRKVFIFQGYLALNTKYLRIFACLVQAHACVTYRLSYHKSCSASSQGKKLALFESLISVISNYKRIVLLNAYIFAIKIPILKKYLIFLELKSLLYFSIACIWKVIVSKRTL